MSNEDHGVAALPAADAANDAQDAAAVLTEALDRVAGLMATNVRDWGMDRADAWLYGLFCGWDCEDRFDDPGHDCADPDETCEGQAAMAEVGRRWHWTRDDVARLRRYREAIRRVQRPAEPEPCVCNGGWTVDQNYQPEDYEAHEPLRPEKGLVPCGLCNHGGWDAPWPPVAAQPPTSEASPQ